MTAYTKEFSVCCKKRAAWISAYINQVQSGGAHCAGLDDKIGSLAPGKEADLLLIRADDINLYPSNNAVGTVVQAAERSNIDTVIIGGRVRKYRGQVVGLDMVRLKAMVEESRSHLFSAVGYRPDVFAELLPKLG